MKLEQMLQGIELHNHLCLIYESLNEWRAVAIPLIAIGLQRREKCIYIVSDQSADMVRAYLGQEGVDVASVEKSGQLLISHGPEVYMREGAFEPERIIDLTIAQIEEAIREGYSGLRETADMSWAVRDYPGLDKLLEYEAKLNCDLIPKYPCLSICQYDRRKFSSKLIKGVIMTHPLLVKENQVYNNFYYVPPEDFLGKNRAAMEVQHWLNNLERERHIQEMREKFVEDILAAAARSAEQVFTQYRQFRPKVLEEKTTPTIKPPLTLRERQILNLVARGSTNRQIGESLRISEQSVKNCITIILRKLNARDRAHAAAIAVDQQWVVVE